MLNDHTHHLVPATHHACAMRTGPARCTRPVGHSGPHFDRSAFEGVLDLAKHRAMKAGRGWSLTAPSDPLPRGVRTRRRRTGRS